MTKDFCESPNNITVNHDPTMSTKLIKYVCYRRWYVLESICYRTLRCSLELPQTHYCGSEEALVWGRMWLRYGKFIFYFFSFRTYESPVRDCLCWAYEGSLNWRFRFMTHLHSRDKKEGFVQGEKSERPKAEPWGQPYQEVRNR